MNEHNLVIAGCDYKYFKNFGPSFISSLLDIAEKNLTMLIVFSGSNYEYENICKNYANEKVLFFHDNELLSSISHTIVDFNYLSHLPLSILKMLVVEQYRYSFIMRNLFKILSNIINPLILLNKKNSLIFNYRPYYTALRFMAPESIINKFSNILVCDIDSKFNADPFSFSYNYKSNKIYAVKRNQNSNEWSNYLTGIILFKGNLASRNYINFQKNINNRIQNSQLFWGMDQFEFDIFAKYHNVDILPNAFYSFNKNVSAVIETYKGSQKWKNQN